MVQCVCWYNTLMKTHVKNILDVEKLYLCSFKIIVSDNLGSIVKTCVTSISQNNTPIKKPNL